MKNIIGDRGEFIFSVLISQKTRNGYLFKPHFLGEKWPTADFYVELFDTDKPMFCFFQIKATTKGYTKTDKKLLASLNAKSAETLLNMPAPTYLIGIDETKEKGYIVSTNEDPFKAVNNIPTTYPLNKNNLVKLWKEVKEFWNNSNIYNYKKNTFSSNFKI